LASDNLDRRAWLLLLGLPFLAYLPVLWGEFNFDDIATVLRNPALGDWPAALAQLGRPGSRALFYLSLNLDHALWGMRPGGYHLTCLGVHLLNVALLATLVRRLASLRADPAPRAAAMAAGFLFGLHPLASSAACYVAQRGTLLVATALLVVFHLLLRMTEAPPSGRWKLGAMAGLVSWLGLLSKPNGVVIPLCALGLLAILPSDRRETPRRWLAAAVPLALAFGIWGLQQAMQTPTQRATWDLYALTQCRVIWRYAGLCLFPFHQTLDPDVLASTGWLAPWTTLLGALALLTLLVWTLSPGRSPWTRAGILMALTALLPESSVVGLPDRIFEYRMYVPLVGLVLAAVPLFPALSPRKAFAILLCLAFLTTGRAVRWQSESALWREALRQAPQKLRPHANLSVRYRLQGKAERAEPLIRRAIRIRPMPEQYRDLAMVALERGDTEAGLAALEPLFRRDPGRADCLPILGRLQLLAGRYDAAVEALTRARAKYPDDEGVLLDLATSLVLTGRIEEAGRLRPELRVHDSAEALLLLGSLQGSQGHLREAAACLARYTSMEPGNPLGWANLAQTLYGLGDREESREARRRAIAACGDDPAYAGMRRALEDEGP
jgi:Flp pilus assembly protein TadD